jgi:DNA-binding SARP family transcriptional activator
MSAQAVVQATLSLLGAARVTLASSEVRLERKTAAVLAYLALEGTTPKYKLAGMLWPDSGETAARNNMRQLLRRLRTSGADIVTGDDRIELLSEVETDVKGLSYLEIPSLELLKRDASLLEGFDYDDAPDFAQWLETTREEFLDLRSRTAEDEASRLEGAGNFKLALEYALLRLKLEPLAEEAYRHVARLHYLLGDRSAALSTLERCRLMLQEEFGAQPLAQTKDLLEMIEGGTMSPGAPQQPKAAIIPASVLRPPVLAGREHEWALMEDAWDQGKLIFLSGDAGSGKSRLATDFLVSKGKFIRQEARPGDVHVPHSSNIRFQRETFRRYPDYHPPLWVKQAMAPWMPELDIDPSVVQGPNSQTRYAEANLEILRQVGLHGEAMFLDDFQFMDEASVQLSLYLFSQLLPLQSPGTMQGFVACFRRAELTPFLEEQLAKMVESGMAVRIEIEPLTTDSITTLVHGLGIDDAEKLVPGLARYTGGNPLFILETLKYLIETNTLKQGLPSRLAPQGKVATLIARRLQRLSPSALNLARVASVGVTDFTMDLAASVLERPTMELAEAHAELETSQILRGNAFSHDLVFEAVLANIPVAVKQLLHSRTAKYLGTLKNANPAVLAQHYLEAGDDLKAAEYYLQASTKAQLASLLKEARSFAERSTAIYQKHGDPREYEATTHLFEIFGIHGSHEEMSSASARLVKLARTPEQKADALAKQADFLHMTRRYSEALEKVDEALALGRELSLIHALLRQVELYCSLRLGRFERAKSALEEYKTLAGQLDNLEVTGSVIEDEGVLYATLDEHEKAVLQFNKVIALIEEVEQYHFAKARLLSRRSSSRLALGLTDLALADVAAAKHAVKQYDISTRGYIWPLSTETFAQLALGNLAKAWEAAQEAERLDKEEDPKVTYLVLAKVLHALGQEERAVAELEAFLSQEENDLAMKSDVLLLLCQITGDALVLEAAERLVARIPKPDLQLKLALAKALFVPPDEVVSVVDKALKLATSLKLAPLEASLLLRKAQALSSLGKFEEARLVIEKAMTYTASWHSPAEVYYTAYQIYEALKNVKAKLHLEKAQTWIDETARTLAKDLRKTFLNQALHKKIL